MDFDFAVAKRRLGRRNQRQNEHVLATSHLPEIKASHFLKSKIILFSLSPLSSLAHILKLLATNKVGPHPSPTFKVGSNLNPTLKVGFNPTPTLMFGFTNHRVVFPTLRVGPGLVPSPQG